MTTASTFIHVIISVNLFGNNLHAHFTDNCSSAQYKMAVLQKGTCTYLIVSAVRVKFKASLQTDRATCQGDTTDKSVDTYMSIN
jgi:hypothetical protein